MFDKVADRAADRLADQITSSSQLVHSDEPPYSKASQCTLNEPINDSSPLVNLEPAQIQGITGRSSHLNHLETPNNIQSLYLMQSQSRRMVQELKKIMLSNGLSLIEQAHEIPGMIEQQMATINKSHLPQKSPQGENSAREIEANRDINTEQNLKRKRHKTHLYEQNTALKHQNAQLLAENENLQHQIKMLRNKLGEAV